MFLKIENTVIKTSEIIKIYTNESGVTIIEIKGSEPLRILDSDKSKYNKILAKLESHWNIIKVD